MPQLAHLEAGSTSLGFLGLVQPQGHQGKCWEKTFCFGLWARL